MRLKASEAKGLMNARNTLTQRVQGPSSEAAVEMEVQGMKDGNVAGFGVFEKPYAYIAVQQAEGKRQVVACVDKQTVVLADDFGGERLWIKVRVSDQGFRARFYYSLDGKRFEPVAEELKMGLGLPWTANRFALFSYSLTSEGVEGHADFNWFRFTDK